MSSDLGGDNSEATVVGYLSGDISGVPLDVYERAELDSLLAALADESTWVEVPPDLGDGIAAAVADIAGDAEHVSMRSGSPAAATTTSPSAQPKPRRLLRWVAPALLGAAAAIIIVLAVTRADRAEAPAEAIEATIQIQGTELAPGIAGTAEIDRRESGLWIRVTLPGLPRRDNGDFYEAWLRSKDGTGLIPIGTFHEGDDVVLWAGVPIEDFPILTVTKESVAGPESPGQGSSGEVVAKGRFTP